eukprot:2079649-Rhodomonas_salina.1
MSEAESMAWCSGGPSRPSLLLPSKFLERCACFFLLIPPPSRDSLLLSKWFAHCSILLPDGRVGYRGSSHLVAATAMGPGGSDPVGLCAGPEPHFDHPVPRRALPQPSSWRL